GLGIAGPAPAGADVDGKRRGLVADEHVSVAERERALVIIGREIVVLVAAGTDQVVALVELVRAGGRQLVAVGGQLVPLLLAAVAVEIAGDLALRAQHGRLPVVFPRRGLLSERQLPV